MITRRGLIGTVLLGAAVLALGGCGQSYPEIKDYCPALGRALTNEERILKGLEFFYNEDERLLRDFPKGTKVSDYAVRTQPHPSEGDQKLKPPFVPKHFQAKKRAAQERNPSINRAGFMEDYYNRFPDCCEVVEPAYVREKWHYSVFEYNVGRKTQWNKDVWIRQEQPFNKGEDVWLKGELRSDICGNADNLKDERG